MGLFSNSKDAANKPTTYYNWVKGDLLGSGNFAEVFQATRKSERTVTRGGASEPVPAKVAIKVIDKSKVEDMNDIVREIDIMQKVVHRNIISLYEVFDAPKQKYLVMELVTGGELFDRIVSKGSYTEKDAADCIQQLSQALNYLHKMDPPIVHRDLKPENLLYGAKEGEEGGNTIKVADFGLARETGGKEMMKTACGTPGYVAPEILNNKGYDSAAVDMWSTGVILYILLCGFPPFYEEELPALFDQILKARYDFPSPWWDSVSNDAKELVKSLLCLDPKKRFTAEQVLENQWIQGNCPNMEKPLSGVQAAMKKYNANRRLRKAALGIIAQQRLEKALAALRVASAEAK